MNSSSSVLKKHHCCGGASTLLPLVVLYLQAYLYTLIPKIPIGGVEYITGMPAKRGVDKGRKGGARAWMGIKNPSILFLQFQMSAQIICRFFCGPCCDATNVQFNKIVVAINSREKLQK